MVRCGIICVSGLVTLLAASSVRCAKTHEQNTDDVMDDFVRTRSDNVPEDDVVTVTDHLYKRSTSNLRFLRSAFDKKINAYLEPSDGVLVGTNTPVWLASTRPNGTIEYKRMHEDIVGTVVDIFKTRIDVSTLIATLAKNESVSYDGMLNYLYDEIWQKMFPDGQSRFRREIDSPETIRTLLEAHHRAILESRSSINENEKLTDLERKIRETRASNETDHSRSKRSRRDIVYPSILIVTDIEQSKTTKNDLVYYDEIIYQLAFWNAVDMRFRRVEDPKIRLRIAGIVIGHDRGAIPYVDKYRDGSVITVPSKFPRPDEYWSAMNNHSEFPLEAYHVVATMTDNAIKQMQTDGSALIIHGLAVRGTLCVRSRRTFYPSALISDQGGFDGILTAAHELGHIMGLDHDKGSGDECDESYHYTMESIHNLGPKNLEWSPCSLRNLSYFLRQKRIKCVDQPAEFYPPRKPVQRILPGDVVDSHDKLCQSLGYTRACDTSPEICQSMKCYHTQWKAFLYGWWCQDAGPAPEGTACSPGHKCLNGACQCVTHECIYGW